ncbi:hypothetical protein M422DRAFT_167513, partial [Sphaerobolus stellatus SS14]
SSIGLRLPSGPKLKPIIGNLLDLPGQCNWITYGQWAKKYGELVYAEALGTHMLWVNSQEMAHEIFDKRASIYSVRFKTVMLEELIGMDKNIGFQHYDPSWRTHRRTMHTRFHSGVLGAYNPIEKKHTRKLLKNLLHKPKAFTQYLLFNAGAIIMGQIAYEMDLKDKDDPYFSRAQQVVRAIDETVLPGAFLVTKIENAWSVMMTSPGIYIPSWVPGAEFQKKATRWRQCVDNMYNIPFDEVKRRISSEGPDQCFVPSHLGENTKFDLEFEEIVRNCAGTMYTASTDTTVNSIRTFIPAMVLNPEVQRKAQNKIDSVVGNQRLVDISDMESLPYTTAVMREAFRGHPLLPTGVAHVATQNNILNGYFIPKGTIVYGNVWCVPLLLHEQFCRITFL